jgi:catechol 2,3-dioxygenase-like lactoylglutathione lyase family enzyme
MELFSLEHIGFLARDPETLKNWYVRTLGATVAFASNTQPPAYLVRLPGGVMLEIGAAASFENDASNNTVIGFRHLALCVDNIESSRAILEKNGVRFTETTKPAGGGGRVLYFADAEGNLLHLVERSGEGKALAS